MYALSFGQLMTSRVWLVLMSFVFFTGCATEKNIPLDNSFWHQKQNKVTVAIVKPTKPGLSKVGAQGLADYAINSAMTDEVNTYLGKTDLTWYYSLPEEFSDKLNKQHITAQTTEMLLKPDEQEYKNIAEKTHSNNILIVQLLSVGAIRSYYSFIPLEPPKAHCVLKGKLFDVNSKKILWQHTVNVTLPVQGEWDKPPVYPNLTNSIKIAIQKSHQEIIDSFFAGKSAV